MCRALNALGIKLKTGPLDLFPNGLMVARDGFEPPTQGL